MLLPLTVAVAASAVMSYRSALAAADVAYDRTLLASTRAIAERVTAEENGVTVDLPYTAIDVFEADLPGRIYYKVTGLAGELVSGYDDFPPMPPGTPRSELYPALVHFYNAEYRGQPVRAAALYHPVSGPGGRGVTIVNVGETLEARHTFARGLLVQTLAQQGLLVALVALSTILAVSRALRPLERLRQDVARRAPSNLDPIDDARVHRELRPLVAALNQHTDRVQDLLESRRRFITDASHQLRTPLAALKTQAEMALRTDSLERTREAVQAIHATTDETVHLMNQLLSLARAKPGSGGRPLAEVELCAIARQVCLDWSPEAVRRGVELAFEGETTPMRGARVLLRELVTNLIDNALRYGGDGGSVTVRVRNGSGRTVLEVEDAGPGITADLRSRVFERFYRIPGATAPGSGLGLSIVKDIVEHHGGTIVLRDARPLGAPRPGLRVTVTFPAAAEAAGASPPAA
jgi:two-component system sensor histidine kinase TctE